MRATSVAPDQAGEASLDLYAARIVALRLVVPVRGIEADHAAFPPKGLEGRFLVVDQRNDDLAIARGVRLADQGEIAVENALVDHRIARHFECIMLAGSEQCGGHREI